LRNLDYRHVIIVFILFITVPIVIKLTYNPSKIKNPVITINKKKISKVELNKRLSKQSYNKDIESLVNSIVIKELLIQKAVKSGIHKDKNFQQSIQNFYEQSLIKLLLDRKYAEFNPEILQPHVNRYVELSDKIIHLTISAYKTLEDQKSQKALSRQRTSMPFNSLSLFLKYTITGLNIGESSGPVFSEAGTEISQKHFTVFTFDRIEQADNTIEKETDTTLIRELLQEQSKEALISEWIDQLKRDATVSLSPSLIDKKQEE